MLCVCLAPRRTDETSVKDVDFSPTGIYGRWQAGYASAADAIKRKPWQGEFDPADGIILHEPPLPKAGSVPTRIGRNDVPVTV